MADMNYIKRMKHNLGSDDFNADVFASDLLGATTAGLSGLAGIAQGAGSLAEGANTIKYDYRLGQMDAVARREGYFNYDTLLNDRLNNPQMMSTQDKDFKKSAGEIIGGVGSSAMSGALAGLEVGGAGGAALGLAVGIGGGLGGLVYGNSVRKGQRANMDASMQLAANDMNNQLEYNTDSISEYMNRQQKANPLAEGGNLNNGDMGTYNTHGAYFSPGLINIDAGGSHESNPYGGVQIGVDVNGTPNLVEEGETVYGDFVFSDRLKPSKRMLIDSNIPEKYLGKSYSEIAKKLSEEADSRPNDSVSQNGLRAMLGRLSEAQEIDKDMRKERKLKKKLDSMSPEEPLAMGNQIGMMNQMAAQQQAQQQMAMQQPQEPTMPQERMDPMLGGGQFAYGGNLFPNGGKVYYDPRGIMGSEWLSTDPNLNPPVAVANRGNADGVLYDPQHVLYNPELLSSVPGLKGATVTARYPQNTGKVYYDPEGLLYNEELLSSVPGLKAPVVTPTPGSGITPSADGVYYDPKRLLYNPELLSAVPGLEGAVVTAEADRTSDGSSSKRNPVFPAPEGRTPVFQESRRGSGYTSRDKSKSKKSGNAKNEYPAVSEGEFLGPEKPYYLEPDFVGPVPRKKPDSNSAPGSGARRPSVPVAPLSLTDSDLDDIMNKVDSRQINMDYYLDPITGMAVVGSPASGLAGIHEYASPVDEKTKERISKKADRKAKRDARRSGDVDALPTAMQYAGPAMSAISAFANALTPPDRTIEDSYKSAMNSGHPVIDYRSAFVDPRYDPLAVNMAQDAILADAAANRRAIMDSGVGPAILPTIAAMNYQTEQGIGNAHMQNRIGNTGMYNQVVQAHNQNENVRSQGRMQAQYQNAMFGDRAIDRNLRLLAYANQAHDAEDTARANAISQSLQLASSGLSGTGRQNVAMNMANSNPANMGYFMNPNGIVNYNSRKCGGKINKRRK